MSRWIWPILFLATIAAAFMWSKRKPDVEGAEKPAKVIQRPTSPDTIEVPHDNSPSIPSSSGPLDGDVSPKAPTAPKTTVLPQPTPQPGINSYQPPANEYTPPQTNDNFYPPPPPPSNNIWDGNTGGFQPDGGQNDNVPPPVFPDQGSQQQDEEFAPPPPPPPPPDNSGEPQEFQ